MLKNATMVLSRIALPAFPIEGGCQCGAVRYTLKAAPMVFYLCHCSECQLQSSSAFGESVSVRPEDLEVRGAVATYERQGKRGILLRDFCPICSVTLLHRRPTGLCNIKGGTFDDRSWLRPAGHIWTASKQPFVTIDDAELSYPQQPDSYDALTARWQEMIGASVVP